MGKRSAVVELFLGDMGSMQRELRPSIQREDQPTMETKLGQIAVKAVNQLPKSVVREIRTPRSVGAGGGQLPPATRWARGNSRPYRESQISRSSGPLGPERDIPLLKIDSKTDSERHQSKIRQQKPGGRVAQLGPSGPGGEFVRAELAAL